MLTTRELRSVIAHEIAHIRQRDLLLPTLAATLSAAIMFVVNNLQFSKLVGTPDDEETSSSTTDSTVATRVPLSARLIRLTIPRSVSTWQTDTQPRSAMIPSPDQRP